MKKLIAAFVLVFGANALAKNTDNLENSLHGLIPDGYVITEVIYGDLNKDNQNDAVLVIKGTDKSKIVTDEHRGELDLNRRGIIVALRDHQKYEVAVKNTSCFHSENEGGGVYFLPDIIISIEIGNLYITYGHGRYGYWRYNFRYQDSDFDLIGFDSSSNRGPIVESATSINFLTKKKLVKENINITDDPYDEVFKETWTDFIPTHQFKLSEISDLGGFFTDSVVDVTN